MNLKSMVPAVLLSLWAIALCHGQSSPHLPAAFGDESLVQLHGHLAPILGSSRDLGRVPPGMPFEHLLIELKRTPAQATALEQTLDDLHNPSSVMFHHWMTAEEFGTAFGATDQQIQQVSDFLLSQGFQVEGFNEGRTFIAFSGIASAVEQAFHTEIHNLDVHGVNHLSNISEPSIPASLGSAITGVLLSDFKPHPLVSGARSVQRNPTEKHLVQVGKASPDFNIPYNGNVLEVVAPGDFATIYNLNPIWSQGFRGAGQTVAVVEDSLIKAADVATFRKAFGLSQYAGTFSQVTPAGSLPCGNPGATSSETEASLDAQWAGATAPDAAIVLAACADTRTEFGGLLATMNLLSQKTPPSVISMSYGECESYMGTIQLNQFKQIFAQAVAEGVTVFVSSGDDGGASCDANQSYASTGLNVSGFASTPYNVAVGGTDFYDTAEGTNNRYWSASNSVTFSSALSYVPEKTWNNSCADSTVLALEKFAVPYGPAGLCNNSPGYNWVTTGSGSGGPSSFYTKPAWQNVAGVPADNARDIPDVSLFAASGFYGHALVFCESDPKAFGVPCNFANPSTAAMDIAGGTSFASPAMAGIFALVTQKYGRQGNANVGLYALAAAQYGTQTVPIHASNCNSTLGRGVGTGCTFYDVTEGNIDLPCFQANCFGSVYSQGYLGALSVDGSQFAPAYSTTAAYDLATGLGTVNVSNLVNNWSHVVAHATHSISPRPDEIGKPREEPFAPFEAAQPF